MIHDLLIVGQGLAGSCVAWEALSRGLRIRVVSDPSRDSRAASRVAGGSCHPISGQRFTPLWKGMEFGRAAEELYRNVEKASGQRFWRGIPTAFIFESEASRELWQKRDEAFRVNGIPIESLPALDESKGLRSSLGGAVSPAGGALEIAAFTRAVRSLLQAQGAWREGLVGASAIQLGCGDGAGEADGIRWGGESFRHAVICAGRFALDEPNWAGAVPWGRTKGETLEVEIPKLSQDCIWKKGMALIPQGCARFRLSATFERGEMGEQTTESGRMKLRTALGVLGSAPFHAGSQHAGIRIHVRDHHPIVGAWPEEPRISFLNALGSKGVLWAPLCARWLVDAVMSGSPQGIPEEVRADRFKKSWIQ